LTDQCTILGISVENEFSNFKPKNEVLVCPRFGLRAVRFYPRLPLGTKFEHVVLQPKEASLMTLTCSDTDGDSGAFQKQEVPEILRTLKDKGFDCSHETKGGLECHDVNPSTVEILTKNPDAVTQCDYTPRRSEITCTSSTPMEIVSQCRYYLILGKRVFRGCFIDVTTSSE
jgi:hypothetical protein